MYARRCATTSATAAVAATVWLRQATRAYRIIPHVHYDIEELAEVQKRGRWQISHRGCMQQPLKRGEVMCERLNEREKRRTGVMPQRAFARRLSQQYAVDGVVHESASKRRLINITVVGFEGHPFHFRLAPEPAMTLNDFINFTGMCRGHSEYWTGCSNEDCFDLMHGPGCLVNVDIETLDRLPPPTRWEYAALTMWRFTDRPDVTHNSRFSCQIRMCAELDGGLFALKQYQSRSLREVAAGWGHTDDVACTEFARSKPIEPWAPILEEPTKTDYPITLDMLWANSYQDIMPHKYSNYRRVDGYSTRPQQWAAYT